MKLWSFWVLTPACAAAGLLMLVAGYVLDDSFLSYTGGGVLGGAVAAFIASFGVSWIFGSSKKGPIRLL